MSTSEKIALAARMHVMLRRKTGRVTDTEWMACNREYAEEIIRFSMDYAQKEGHDDLAELAEKLAAVMLPARPQTTYKKTDLSNEGTGLIRYIRGIR
ncbi:hypothetical protein MIZ03_3196 [Rhodoferax lithotrophicus]|uniref:Uncharacterized protein n=1 Tax=Rhodoferax lithotrophicus TaxID=2798804 RepID=A0ABN6DBT1_9BURK|nr:hypothetical protein [Rhodoferax sp. MIZ03]BCO28296.1 hypothetical protein MIZ03_3196 [Rhodoferax sp. MIZ03]